MIKMSSRTAVAAAFASFLLVGSASAQTAAAPPAKPSTMAPATTEKMAKPHTAASIECSKEADAKGLHGKERKKFRSDCKKQAKDSAAAPASK